MTAATGRTPGSLVRLADFRAAALAYRDSRGWTCHPLRKNEDGFAKVPITSGWQKLTTADVAGLDWSDAEGIGLVLGPASENAAVIDIDHGPLASAAVASAVRAHLYPRLAWTARGRVHIYAIEPEPSPSRVLKLRYRGEPANVELKSAGAQVALPPTPRYKWGNDGFEPLYGSLSELWARFAVELGTEWDTSGASHRGAGAGYPKPFRPVVEYGEHNMGLFIEACRLAEEGVPIAKAITFLRRRFDAAYRGGAWGRWAERTIESAYKRVVAR